VKVVEGGRLMVVVVRWWMEEARLWGIFGARLSG
jgi:hypothetical protein